MRKLTSALLVVLIATVAAQAAGPSIVSLVKLIASPRDFDGKHVIVFGVPRIEFEGTCLFLHMEDYERGLPNALWLSVPRDKYSAWKALEGKYVVVAGTFSTHDTGHGGIYSGAIHDITRFELFNASPSP